MEKTLHEIRFRTNDWPDYIVRVWLENSAVCGVEAFDVIGLDDADRPLMLKKGWTSSPYDSTTNCDEAELFIEGSIKWDGCSHLNFGRGGYIHFCGMKPAARIGELIARLYGLARDTMGPGGVHDVALFEGY